MKEKWGAIYIKIREEWDGLELQVGIGGRR